MYNIMTTDIVESINSMLKLQTSLDNTHYLHCSMQSWRRCQKWFNERRQKDNNLTLIVAYNRLRESTERALIKSCELKPTWINVNEWIIRGGGYDAEVEFINDLHF